MKFTRILIRAISISTVLAAARSNGQTLTVTLLDIDHGLEVSATLNDGVTVGNYRSGVYHFAGFEAFCVEVSQGIDYGETLTYQVQDINLLANSDKIARLVGGYLASPQTNEHAAALQWAIWETTTESLSTLSLLSGNVRITNPASEATAALVEQYLANANTYTPATLTYLTNATRQDMITWSVVPEPSSLGLATLSAVLLLRRRR